MAIVTVKNKYQVVIPRNVREELGIQRGDLLEAKVERGKLTYTRKRVIDRTAAEYPLETVMRIIREQNKHPMTARQLAALDAELAAYGAKQAKKAGIRESDIPRIVHESRTRRRRPA